MDINTFIIVDELLFTNDEINVIELFFYIFEFEKYAHSLILKVRNPYYGFKFSEPEEWLEAYNDTVFFQLYRMKKETFSKLMDTIIIEDNHNLIKKKYRGGNYPIQPEKSLLIFLWYIGRPDTLNSIGARFNVLPSTVMRIVNALLYIVIRMKKRFIIYPQTEEEFGFIKQQFTSYPGVIGAVDGTHINIKIVPIDQHDSYVDRYSSHSINLMAICTAENIFTYIFVGYPGSAHDSRVFQNSAFVRNIERYGKQIYFPKEEYHLVGDSAFPLRTWLMTPYSRRSNLNRIQAHLNKQLSSDRICIEHTFGILKGRWRRLHYINTYSISKSIEITTAACILHNFCYLNSDQWTYEPEEINMNLNMVDNREEQMEARIKRDNIAQNLFH